MTGGAQVAKLSNRYQSNRMYQWLLAFHIIAVSACIAGLFSSQQKMRKKCEGGVMKLFVTAALVLFAPQASAETYPSRPVPIVVPPPAGGPPDPLARLIAEPMRTVLGQPIIVEN